jgi:hypothetical protein
MKPSEYSGFLVEERRPWFMADETEKWAKAIRTASINPECDWAPSVIFHNVPIGESGAAYVGFGSLAAVDGPCMGDFDVKNKCATNTCAYSKTHKYRRFSATSS